MHGFFILITACIVCLAAFMTFVASFALRGKRRKKMMTRSMLVGLFAFGYPYLTIESPPLAMVENRSDVVLKNVSVWYGVSQMVEPGESIATLPPVRGESSLQLIFTANGHRKEGQSYYVENTGGYRIRYVVHPDLTVTSSRSEFTFPNWRYYLMKWTGQIES